MTIALTVLGCSGSYPGPGQACSGYLVEGGGASIWLDTGSGTLANLQRHLSLDDLDAVVVTHAHADHWTDLLTWYVVVRHFIHKSGFPVYGSAHVKEQTDAVQPDLSPTFDWRVMTDGSEAAIGGLRLRFSRTDHPGETLAVRFDDGDGASLGYSADTGLGWSLSELGSDVGLALCEAGLPESEERRVQHLSPRQAGVSARSAGARRLVLTHLRPGTDAGEAAAQASATFGGPVEVAAPGARFEVTA